MSQKGSEKAGSDLGTGKDCEAGQFGQLLDEVHALLRDPGAADKAKLLQVDQGCQLGEARVGEGVAVHKRHAPQAPHWRQEVQALGGKWVLK